MQTLEIAKDTLALRSLDWDRDRFDIEFGYGLFVFFILLILSIFWYICYIVQLLLVIASFTLRKYDFLIVVFFFYSIRFIFIFYFTLFSFIILA